MKLLLVNDQGEAVACFERVEHYDAQKPSSVLALLDFLETLLATAKEKGAPQVPSHRPQPSVPDGRIGLGTGD